MREFQRTERLGAQFCKELAAIFQEMVRDPRLGIITIQEVRVTNNLAHAKIFFTCFNSNTNSDTKTTETLLNTTLAGFLRRELAHRMRMRVIPKLQFIHDTTIEYGEHLTRLINQVTTDQKN
ncbi:ribosome-binding factor A [Achromatium sp. WMS3]|nr:ribosome-binding factor A [Achromatium sp. WMS3]